MFPPMSVVCGNTQRAKDLPEAFLFHTEGDVDLIVILVDFIEKWLYARKHSNVDAAPRIPYLPSEKLVWLFGCSWNARRLSANFARNCESSRIRSSSASKKRILQRNTFEAPCAARWASCVRCSSLAHSASRRPVHSLRLALT